MIILASEHINVQCHTRRDSKGIEYMRDHLGGKIPDLFSLET